MKKLAVIVVVMLAAAVPGWCKVGDKLVLEVNASVKATANSGGSFSDDITKDSSNGTDQLSVTYTGRQVWKVVEEYEGEVVLEELSCKTNRSGSGGGSGKSEVKLHKPLNGVSLCRQSSGSWSYKVSNTDETDRLPTPEINLKKGTYRVPEIFFFGGVTGSGKGMIVEYKLDGSSDKMDVDETGGLAFFWVAPAALAEAYEDEAFTKKFEGSLTPNSKSFSVSQTATYSMNQRVEDNNAPGKYTDAKATVQVQYTLSFNYTPEELEAVLIPGTDYSTWTPKGAANEKTAGNSTTARVELYVKGQPGKRPKSMAKFRAELIDTSREPGVCLNYPVQNPADDYDLKIDPAENKEFQVSENGQSATSRELGHSCVLVLSSYDWGAYGKLKVTAITQNGQSVEAVVKGIGGSELVLPMDKNGNHIADAWEKAHSLKSTSPNWDEETSKDNGNNGDGFSLYEEYRGVMASTDPASHKSLNPTSKDIILENFVGASISGGISLFQSATGMKIIELKPGLLRQDRIVNANSRFKHNGDQYGLRIKSEKFAEEGILAVAMPEREHPSPKDCDEILINAEWAAAYSSKTASQAKKNEIKAGFNVAVPHEIAHALSVQHHGDDSEEREVELKSYSPAELYDAAGNVKAKPITISNIGSAHGTASGDTSCFMTYIHLVDWAHNKRENWFREVPRQAPGSTFCNSTRGTGINANGAYFGDCSYGRGNCLGKMQVKDY